MISKVKEDKRHTRNNKTQNSDENFAQRIISQNASVNKNGEGKNANNRSYKRYIHAHIILLKASDFYGEFFDKLTINRQYG